MCGRSSSNSPKCDCGNDQGRFVGAYIAEYAPHSFTWFGIVGDRDSVTTINLGALTEVNDISNNGTIAGDYIDDPLSSGVHGFIMSSGVVTTHDFPGAVRTFVKGINNDGWAVGIYNDGHSNSHGFISAPLT